METTLYVGGLLEKMTRSGITEYRHSIQAGEEHTVLYTRRSNGTTDTFHVTRDHLGSASAITNSAGTVLVNESFTAFGERRGANWTGTPSSGDWTQIANTTRRGFTDHEHLDNLNLIHMNGRVYDPGLGRFLSADPFIDGWTSTQGYNRYSYVKNNPLRAFDPSGFSQKNSNQEEKTDTEGAGRGSYVNPDGRPVPTMTVYGQRPSGNGMGNLIWVPMGGGNGESAQDQFFKSEREKALALAGSFAATTAGLIGDYYFPQSYIPLRLSIAGSIYGSINAFGQGLRGNVQSSYVLGSLNLGLGAQSLAIAGRIGSGAPALLLGLSFSGGYLIGTGIYQVATKVLYGE